MFNNPATNPHTGDFVKDTPDLLSNYLCIHTENKQLTILCFRNSGPKSPIISKNNSRKFSYTKNKPVNPVVFRKGSYPLSYKKNSLIRDSFVNSIRLASLTKHRLKDVGGTKKYLNVRFRSKGVKS